MTTRNSRKEVDLFLVELNIFIGKYIDIFSKEEIFNLMIPFKSWVPSTCWPTLPLKLDNLVPMVNKTKHNSDAVRSKRGSNYVRRVGYKLQYISVKWNNYQEVFHKMFLDKWNQEFKIKGLKINDFYKDNPWKELKIPEDYWQVNFDMYVLWEYEII